METLGYITFIYLAIGLLISLLLLGIMFLKDGKILWKRYDLLFTLPIGFITVTVGWFPIVLMGLYALGAVMGLFSCKVIKKKRIKS